MAVRVNSDMPPRQVAAAKYTGVTLQKNPSSSVSTAMFDMKKSGALISPVPRSVIARLMRRTLAGVSRDGVLQNETSTRAFSSVATGDIATVKTLAVMAAPGLPSVRKLSGEIEQQQVKELRFIITHQVNDNCSQQVCCVFTAVNVEVNLHLLQPEHSEIQTISVRRRLRGSSKHREFSRQPIQQGSIVRSTFQIGQISFKIPFQSIKHFGSTDKNDVPSRNPLKVDLDALRKR